MGFESNKAVLFDNHGRQINYLRLAVTDRCNLRCFYCMPEEGIKYVPKDELLSYEEMLRIINVLAKLGITKIRITGGEPFVRKGMMGFIEEVTNVPGITDVHITTNGTMTKTLVPTLQKIGIASVNLSLDTLDPDRFLQITRRDLYTPVMETLSALIASDIRTKINTVVMPDRNIQDIVPMVEMTRNSPVAVRFIEEMPFNGTGLRENAIPWNHVRILEEIQRVFGNVEKLDDPPFSTSTNYRVKGHLGTFGIIAAYSRTFCGTCNRIRITPQGTLKTCLYDNGVFNAKSILRAGATDAQLGDAFLDALSHRAKDGWEAEGLRQANPISESMSTIGG